MVKKLLFFVLIITMLLSLIGCSSGSSGDKALIGEWKVVSHEYDKEVIRSNSIIEMKADIFSEIFPEGSSVIIKENNTMELPLYSAQSDYKVEDDKIFTRDVNTGNWSPDYVTYTMIDANTMTWYTSGITFKFEKQ